MDGKKKYTKADFDNYVAAVDREVNGVLVKQRERIEELKQKLAAAEAKNAEFEEQKELIYKAITAALKKADDIERVSILRYNQELAQLKSFHDKWTGYFDKIIAKYPLDGELVATSKVNARISEILGKADNIEAQYESERDRLKNSLKTETASKPVAEKETASSADYADRSPAGFSFTEALHPKDDLKDIMKELGIVMDE